MGLFNSSADIIKGALQKAGEVTNGNSKYHDLAIKYLNHVYLAILSGSNEFDINMGEAFYWAREENPKTITLLPKYTTGTISITNGSNAGSFSAAPAISLQEYFIRPKGEPTYYKITAHNAGETNFTLNGNVVETTNAAAEYQAIKLIYDAGSNILRLVDSIDVYESNETEDLGKISGMDYSVLKNRYPLKHIREGIPESFAVYHQDNDNFKVIFSNYPREEIKVDLDYVALPENLTDSANSIPKIPLQHRSALEYGTAFMLLIDKDDDKANMFFSIFKNKLKAIIEERNKQATHTGLNRGKLIARRDQVSRFKKNFRRRLEFLG